MSKTEKSEPRFKATKERLTLLLGGNSSGDFKLKSFLIYQSENPRAIKGSFNDQLSAHLRSNKKVKMTVSLFKDWISTCAIPASRS